MVGGACTYDRPLLGMVGTILRPTLPLHPSVFNMPVSVAYAFKRETPLTATLLACVLWTGMLDETDRCICASECPAKDLIALQEAARIRGAAKMHGQSELRQFVKGSTLDVEYTYLNAFKENSLPGVSCAVDAGTFRKALKDAYNGKLVSKDTVITIDEDKYTISIKSSLTGTGGILDGQKASFSDPVLIDGASSDAVGIDVSEWADGALALMMYHGVIESMSKLCALGKSKKLKLLKQANVKYMSETTTVVYGGGNLPQIDVNRFVDGNNKDGVVTAVYDAIKDLQGWTDLNKEVMSEKWGLVPAADIHKKGRRGAPARLGLATNLIHVELEYNRWSSTAGPNKAAVVRVINWVLATYNVQTHHKCFSFEAGFDDGCVEDIVSTIIAKELKACTDVDLDSVATCRNAAVSAAKKKLIEIKGCGLLGTVIKDGEDVCADPASASKAKADANTNAAAAVDAAIAKISTARRKDLERQLQEALALNATKAEQASKRKDKADRLISAATLTSFQVSTGGVEAALKAAIAKTTAAKAALDTTLAALNKCEVKWPSKVPYHSNCNDLAEAFYKAEQDHSVGKAARDVLQTRSDSANMSDAEKADRLAKQNLELDTLRKATTAKQKGVEKIESEIKSNACDRTVQYGATSTCAKLFDELDAKTKELAATLAKLEALSGKVEVEQKIVANTKAEQNDAEPASIVPLIIAVVATIFVCLIIMGIVVVTMGKNEVKRRESLGTAGENRQVTAFSNPMYADADGNGPSGATKENQNSAFIAPQPDQGDQGLYDEPAFGSSQDTNNGEVEGGYLDVNPETESESEDSDN